MERITNYINDNGLNAEQAQEYIDSLIWKLEPDERHRLLLFFCTRYGFIPSQNKPRKQTNTPQNE